MKFLLVSSVISENRDRSGAKLTILDETQVSFNFIQHVLPTRQRRVSLFQSLNSYQEKILKLPYSTNKTKYQCMTNVFWYQMDGEHYFRIGSSQHLSGRLMGRKVRRILKHLSFKEGAVVGFGLVYIYEGCCRFLPCFQQYNSWL